MQHIYQITNKINGKIYIGRTIQSLSARFRQHKQEAFYKKSNCYLHAAIRKYGKENFEIQLIKSYPFSKDIRKTETWWIRRKHSLNRNIGYNLKEYDGKGNKIPLKAIINMINSRKNKRSNKKYSSKYFGVHYLKELDKWAFNINFKNKTTFIKRFATQKDAAIARDYKILELYKNKDISNMLNFPQNLTKYLNKSIPYPKRVITIAYKKSKYRWVSYDKTFKGWYVCVCITQKQRIKKGMFETEREAAQWADKISLETFGNKIKLNFSNNDYLNPNYQMPQTCTEKHRKSKFPYVYYDNNTNKIYIDIRKDGKRFRKYNFQSEETANQYLKDNLLF